MRGLMKMRQRFSMKEEMYTCRLSTPTHPGFAVRPSLHCQYQYLLEYSYYTIVSRQTMQSHEKSLIIN